MPGAIHNVAVVEGRQRTVARWAAAVVAVFWGYLWFGLIDLLVVVEQDARFDQHYLMESGWGLLFLVLVTVPLVVLAIRPGDAVPLAQLAVVTLAVLVCGLWRGSWPELLNGLGLVLTSVALARLGSGRLVAWRRPDWVLSVLAMLGLPLALLYAAPLIGNTTEVEDITNGVSHYPMQGALALAVVGLVALAAVTRDRLPAWTAAFSALWLGVESMVYAGLPGSLGRTWGAVTAAWSLIVVASVELARRRGIRR